MHLPRAAPCWRFGLLLLIAAAGDTRLACVAAEATHAALAGYADYDEFARQAVALAKPGWCEVSSLGTTLGTRKIFLISVTGGPALAADKPAILIVGSVHAPQLMGSELAMRIARRLIDRAGKDAAVKELLERFAFYIIPRPSPDASEAFFQRPLREREGNLRSTHDARDPDAKDSSEDLNSDGMITMMRVADDAGHWMTHPDDPRILIAANHEKAEHGQYELYAEGRHDDDAPNRDAARDGWGAGVAFNHNFPFRYPYLQVRAPGQMQCRKSRVGPSRISLSIIRTSPSCLVSLQKTT